MESLAQQDLEAQNKRYSVNSWTLLFFSMNFAIVAIPVQSAVFFSWVALDGFFSQSLMLRRHLEGKQHCR